MSVKTLAIAGGRVTADDEKACSPSITDTEVHDTRSTYYQVETIRTAKTLARASRRATADDEKTHSPSTTDIEAQDTTCRDSLNSPEDPEAHLIRLRAQYGVRNFHRTLTANHP